MLPAPELLVEQPGASDPRRFVPVAKAEDDSWAMAYMPESTTIALRTGLIKGLPPPDNITRAPVNGSTPCGVK